MLLPLLINVGMFGAAPAASQIKYWDGAVWQTSGVLKYWDGAAWQTSGVLKYWDGSGWVNV